MNFHQEAHAGNGSDRAAARLRCRAQWRRLGCTLHPVGSGLVKCTKIKGTINFNPPLQTSGTASSETTTTSATATGCSGGTPNPSKVISTSSTTTTGTDVTLVESGHGLSPDDFRVLRAEHHLPELDLGRDADTISSPKIGFTIIERHHDGFVPSTTTDISVTTKDTLTKFDAACDKPAGVASLKIVKGSVNQPLIVIASPKESLVEVQGPEHWVWGRGFRPRPQTAFLKRTGRRPTGRRGRR